VSFDLSVTPQNRRREADAGDASRPRGLLRVKASLTSVYQYGLKTDDDATTGGAHGSIAEVASEAS
jgi:hypothetical protein